MPLTARQARLVLRQNAIILENTVSTLRREVDVVVMKAAERGKTSADFVVPPFIFGLPVFDRGVITELLLKNLQKDGYNARQSRSYPCVLRINFAPPKGPSPPRRTAFQQLKAMNRALRRDD